MVVSVLALFASIAALGVSLYPYVQETSVRQDATVGYLDRLVGVEWNDALRAKTFAVKGGDAELLASVINNAWLAGQYTEPEVLQLEAGSVTSRGAGEYEVCFPRTKLPIFSDNCYVFSHFEFNETDRISRFAVDGVPVDALLPVRDFTDDLTLDEGGGPIDAYPGGVIVSPDGSEKIVLLDVRQIRGGQRDPIQFQSVRAENAAETDTPIIESSFPSELTYYGRGWAAVKVGTDAQFLLACWSGVPEGSESCSWVYL